MGDRLGPYDGLYARLFSGACFEASFRSFEGVIRGAFVECMDDSLPGAIDVQSLRCSEKAREAGPSHSTYFPSRSVSIS